MSVQAGASDSEGSQTSARQLGKSEPEYIPVVLGVDSAFHSVSTAMAAGLIVFVLFAEHFPDLVPPRNRLLALGRFLSLLPVKNCIPLMKRPISGADREASAASYGLEVTYFGP